jgi:hypothetical protein
MSLPKEINYSKMASLPKGTTSLSIVVSPANGASFGESQQIQFNLPSRSYLVPESIYLRFKVSTSGQTTQNGSFRGAFPGYTPFIRCETLIGSSVVESISNYGQLNSMLLSCKVDYGQKLGLAYSMGVQANTGADLELYTMNGHAIDSLTESFFVAIPLNCLFANASSLIPLKYMPASTIQLTTDTIANMIYSPAGTDTPTAITFTNLELVADLIDFNSEVDDAIMSMVDERGKILIKSQSYMSSGQTTAAISSGSLEYIYSMRLASIKSLFLILAGTHANSLNKNFDSLDITTNNGSYQFFIASAPYPSRPISTILNKAGVLAELSQAFGPVHDLTTTKFSITPKEFNYTNNSTTTIAQCGKFFVGCNTERLSTNQVMLSGVSSQNSPLSCRIDINTATTNSQILNLVALFDAIIEVDIMNKQASVLQ